MLNNVNFRYTVPSFQVIVGHNGSGKSTLLDMLMNYYAPDEGSILINDIDIRELEAENLYSKIVYIRQKPFFFNMSIIENFRLIDGQISFDEVSRVCQMVGMHEHIMSLPKQYDTELGEDGTHFSGGQIQCLAIARGLVLNADIYLLDEVTSDLDGENEQQIMKILRSIHKIVIFVTHRLSEIEPSDEILVLEEGRVVAEGRGEDLEKSCQIYRNLSGIK
ncbi:MAG: ABC transporter ATP-binding protein/permease [Lachnospiraceae bacterium]|nr:ABC transporter ATP-binding protein/permease [Lachnospiraceae bacterium]